MPPRDLREPYETLAAQLIETIREGGATGGDQPDLRYGVRAVLRKFEVRLRPVPLDSDEIRKPPDVCPVCRKPTGSSVAELRLTDGERVHAHPECVNWPKREP
jgi:hypothetical protein